MGASISLTNFRSSRNISINMVASENLQEAAFIFASNPEFRLVFINYVLQISWIQAFFTENPNIFLFGETNETSYDLPYQYDNYPDDQTVKITFDDDLIRRSSRTETLNTPASYTSVLSSIFANEEVLFPLILACAYPCFLKSQEFHVWLLTQKNTSVFEQSLLNRHYTRETGCFDFAGQSDKGADMDFINSSELSMIPGDVHFIAKRSQNKQAISRSSKPDFIRLKSLLQACIQQHMTEEKIESILVFAPRTWLPSLKSFLDSLPVAVSIASARPHPKSHENFPLVFINKAFEKMTQYRAEEVLGRNCRFLQSESTVEMEQVQKIREALRCIFPIKLAVTNARKDGTPFYNFLALRPVFNNANEYSFVVGINYEVSPSDFHRFLREHNECATRTSNEVLFEDSKCSDRAAEVSSSADENAEVSVDLGNFARDFQMIEDLLNIFPSMLY